MFLLPLFMTSLVAASAGNFHQAFHITWSKCQDT